MSAMFKATQRCTKVSGRQLMKILFSESDKHLEKVKEG